MGTLRALFMRFTFLFHYALYVYALLKSHIMSPAIRTCLPCFCLEAFMGSLLFNPCSLEVSMKKGKSKAWLNFLFQRLKKPVKKVISGAIRQKINYSKHGKMKLVKPFDELSLIFAVWFCTSLFVLPYLTSIYSVALLLLIDNLWLNRFGKEAFQLPLPVRSGEARS